MTIWASSKDIQQHQASRQDEFKGELAQRTKVGEHRRDLKNSLVSSFMKHAVHNSSRIWLYNKTIKKKGVGFLFAYKLRYC